MKDELKNMTPLVIPSMPADESLQAFKTWLIEESLVQGVTVLETDLTDEDWIEQHENYWQHRK